MKINFDTDDISTRTVAKWLLLLAAGVLIYHLGYMCGIHRAHYYSGGYKCGGHFNMESPIRDSFGMEAMHEQMMGGGNAYYGYGTAPARPAMMDGSSAGGIRIIKMDDQGGQRVLFYRAQ